MSNQHEQLPASSTAAGAGACLPTVQAALAAIHLFNPQACPQERLPDVHPALLPQHIAIIMDGNGRWATARGFPRGFGHVNGAAGVRTVLEECVRLGIRVLTLYSFSLENWKRPAEEVAALMELCRSYVDGEEAEMQRQGIQFRTIGRREGLPAAVLASIDRVSAATQQNKRCVLNLAINYGGRAELVDAARAVAQSVQRGEISLQDIDEDLLASHLTTRGLPDPDLFIRTAGEMRISNFLLWQVSYAELFVTPALWPDFGIKDLHAAVRAYAQRQRRFGALGPVQPQTV